MNLSTVLLFIAFAKKSSYVQTFGAIFQSPKSTKNISPVSIVPRPSESVIRSEINGRDLAIQRCRLRCKSRYHKNINEPARSIMGRDITNHRQPWT